MKYNLLGRTGFKVSEIGLGGEYLEGKPASLVNDVVSAAMDGGVNILDCFMSNPEVRSNLGAALKGRRDRMYIQGHLRSVWKDGQYGRTMDMDEVRFFFKDFLDRFQTDYVDIGIIHLIDNPQDYDRIFDGPILEYALKLKELGVIRSLGISSHNPVQALRAAKSGVIDMMLFSINPAYDVMDENAPRPKKLDNGFFNDIEVAGVNSVREELYSYCEANGIGITVMKTLAAGALLDARTSPFGAALTVPQCIHYALTRPGVASVLLGMQSVEQVADCLSYENLDLPCSAHIDIAQVNKYLDMACLDDTPMATLKEHYHALEHNAEECIACHACEIRCPFGVDIVQRMMKAREIFR